MIYKNMNLPCTNDIIKTDNISILSRLPNELNKKLGHEIAYHMYGQEIQLVPLSAVTITLASGVPFAENKCVIYYGDYGPAHEISFQKEATITVYPSFFNKQGLPVEKQLQKNSAYSIHVVRILLLCKSVGIVSIQGDYRSPKAEELPKEKMLVYGTSLSQGTSVTFPEGPYPWQIARKLNMEVHNYALAGMCLIEKEMMDFLVSRKEEYSLIILEPSTNLFAQGYDVEEFIKRCSQLYKFIRRRWPFAVILFIDLFPSLFDFGLSGDFHPQCEPVTYRKALRSLVKESKDQRMHCVHAEDLLSTTNLCADLLHPTNLGYIEISSKLYDMITKKHWLYKEYGE